MYAAMSLHHLLIRLIDLTLMVVRKDDAANLSVCGRNWATIEDMNQSSLLFDLRLLHRRLRRTALPGVRTVTSFLSLLTLTHYHYLLPISQWLEPILALGGYFALLIIIYFVFCCRHVEPP